MRMRLRSTLISLSLLAACTSAGGDDDVADAGTGESSPSTSEVTGESESSPSTSEASETLASTDTSDASESGVDCHYPAGAVEPMALDEVITPYAWTEALAFDGTSLPLALIHAPCDDSPDGFAWTRPLLVFISLPAW
jgi:hypothetical protein